MTIPDLLIAAWLLPLLGFAVEVFFGYWGRGLPGGVRRSPVAAWIAVGCIGGGFILSLMALVQGVPEEPIAATIYQVAHFGSLQISIDYYIDGLTLAMFTMITLIATCIHVFAIGYMDDELTDDHVDHQVHMSDGSHLHRPGRFHLFFSYMSLFCFSMLGLVLAGNVFMVFVFWELVGICSYLLIGFYVERHSASTAANKAFIVNRIGDFGFLIGMMILWTSFGTLAFGELFDADKSPSSISHMLLVVAGLGIFAGCVGKSAQFPLQTWLPDAMEGPTPVSALVHSATMVAAGVYLAVRFTPMFASEVLLVIAYVGCITLFVAATIAVVATDIKRVLAYSTISQLGYMMLAVGVGAWGAAAFHLVTHAFFKSLMFLCSGSVIIGCHHEQEMPRMGGLLKKMPWTACTMLVGVIAICGLGIPVVTIAGYHVAFSGYHSKDAILAGSLAFGGLNDIHFLLFLVPLVTAGITAFYMFRLWFYTFLGQPRDEELHKTVHESSRWMVGPLVVLAIFAALVAFDHGVHHEPGRLYTLLTHGGIESAATTGGPITLPTEHDVEEAHVMAGSLALGAALLGTLLAYLMYGPLPVLSPDLVRRQFAGTHQFLVEKWRFDELYDVMFVRPVHVVAGWIVAFDRRVLDGFLHAVVRSSIDVSAWDRRFDEGVIDGAVNLVGNVINAIGRSLRVVQTGRLRQYVMFIALGVVTLFVLMFAFFPR